MNLKGLIKKQLFGKKRYQSFFRRLFDISIEGLNIGVGGREIDKSGEFYAIKVTLQNESNPIVFDVGAQGGKYFEYALKINSSCEVYAFEPRSEDWKILNDNYSKPNIHLIQEALGEKPAKAKLYFDNEKSGLSSLLLQNGPNNQVEEIQVNTIDQFCLDNGIKFITLLKLDTEGYELSCLRGATKMLPKIKYIQFEMSIGSRNARVYFEDIFLFLKDYKIYRILRNGLVEIQETDRLSELLFTTNYLAIRKQD